MEIRLNGWQRLWVVVSAAWIAYYVYWLIEVRNPAGMPDAGAWMFVVVALGVFIVPPAILYALGVVTVWVIRGFRRGSK